MKITESISEKEVMSSIVRITRIPFFAEPRTVVSLDWLAAFILHCGMLLYSPSEKILEKFPWFIPGSSMSQGFLSDPPILLVVFFSLICKIL